MPFHGKCWTGSFNTSSDMILSARGVAVGGGIKAIINIRPEFRERYFAPYVNEKYIGENRYCDILGNLEFMLPASIGTAVDSVWLEDVGLFSGIDEDTSFNVGQHARVFGALTGDKICLTWTNTNQYTRSTIVGDTQLSSITVTGAKRAVNVENIPGFPQRGRLYYSITTNAAGTKITRFYKDNLIVAEGTGTGAQTASALNGSGLSVAYTLTYSADVLKGVAWFDLKWPAHYEIHYSTSAMSLPRTADAIVYDRGIDSYRWPAPTAFAAGAWNVGIVAVDDEGDKATAITYPADSPFTIRTVPAAPTITSVSVAGSTITTNWTVGESGCTFTIYGSEVNGPVNFGKLVAGPTPTVTAANATTGNITLPAFTTQNDETAYNTLVSDWATAVAALNTGFDTSEASFESALSTYYAPIGTTLSTFGTAVKLGLMEAKQGLSAQLALLQAQVDSVDGAGLTHGEWKLAVGGTYGGFIQYLGLLVNNQPYRYSFPNGALAGSDLAAETTGTGTNADGSSGASVDKVLSMYDAVQPFVKSNIVRIVVRATKASVQEKTDSVYEFEVTSAGALVTSKRPTQATIKSIAAVGSTLTFTVVGQINEDNAEIAATHLDLYIVKVGTGITLASPTQSQTVPSTGTLGIKVVTFTAVAVGGGAGTYQILVVSRASTVRNENIAGRIKYVDINSEVPIAPIDVFGAVTRTQ